MKRSTWNLIVFALIVSLLSIACAQLGVTPLKRAPHSVEEGLWISSESINGMVITFTQLRVDRITTAEQHAKITDQLQTAHDTVQRGLNAYKSAIALCVQGGTPLNLCDVGEAQTALDKAELTLQALAALLAQFGAQQAAASHAVLIYVTQPQLETPT